MSSAALGKRWNGQVEGFGRLGSVRAAVGHTGIKKIGNSHREFLSSHSLFALYRLRNMLLPFFTMVGIWHLWTVPGHGGTLEKAPVNVQPSAPTTTPWEITVEGPGWLAGVNGTVGSHGVTSNVDIGVTDILKRTNVVASFGAEVRRDRSGAYEVFYLDAQTSEGGTVWCLR